MTEQEILNIISKYADNNYIGDDCAFLQEFGIVISQDSLIENIHFLKDKITPFQLGYKSLAVNVSDISASGAIPKYITISLSLPKNIEITFIDNFYKGINYVADKLGIKIIGGDITGGEKICISIAIIGDARNVKIASRKNAKTNYKVIVSGTFGSSSAGLKQLLKLSNTEFNNFILNNGELLQNTTNIKNYSFIKDHIFPPILNKLSYKISKTATKYNFEYAMMDASDGLMDALCKIANASNVDLLINCGTNYTNIPHNKDIENFDDWKNLMFFGGEDYQLVACVPKHIETNDWTTIGEVIDGNGSILLEEKNKTITKKFNLKSIQNNVFQHF